MFTERFGNGRSTMEKGMKWYGRQKMIGGIKHVLRYGRFL
jgi:hypothetical protein